MVLSAAIMVAYVALQATFGPKPDPQAIARQAEVDAAKKKEDAKKSDTKKADASSTGEKVDTPATDKPVAEKPADVDATSASPQWLTLGSVDPSSSYRMLVTLSSKGGAIERIE